VPSALEAVREYPARSATTLVNSQDVTGGLSDSLRLPVTPVRAAMMSYQPGMQGSPAGHRVERTGSQL
jgi:hypothetical protein